MDRTKNLEFTLLSTRDANPPVFTLYFEVMNTPPTTVTCSIDSIAFTITEEDLNRVPIKSTDLIRVAINVTVRRREAGEYICAVNTTSSIKSFCIASTSGLNISGKL